MHAMAHTVPLVLAGVLMASIGGGCASHGTEEAIPPTPTVASPKGSAPVVASASASSGPTPQYDVHEWGVVREDQNATLRVGAIPPSRASKSSSSSRSPSSTSTPDAPLRLKRVAVDVPGGDVVETWPIASRDGEKGPFAWRDVSVDPISPCTSSRLPRKTDPPCSKLPPGECESAGLADVRTVDSSCVRVGDATETFLFYRGSTAAVTPPLRVERAPNGDVVVTNDGDLPIPGLLVRIETAGRTTKTLGARPPLPHASVVVGRAFPTNLSPSPFERPEDVRQFRGLPPAQTVTGTARDDIRTSMREVGLLDTEVDGFAKAWDASLFGVVVRNGSPITEAQTSFLYWLPEASVPRYATVSFDPPPRSFRRALAVWTRLADSGSGH